MAKKILFFISFFLLVFLGFQQFSHALSESATDILNNSETSVFPVEISIPVDSSNQQNASPFATGAAPLIKRATEIMPPTGPQTKVRPQTDKGSALEKEEIPFEVSPVAPSWQAKEEVERVDFKLKYASATSVEFYLQRSDSAATIYVGSGAIKEGDVWEYQLDVKKLPNADYKIFPKIQGQDGISKGEEKIITVNNPLKPDVSGEEKVRQEIAKQEKDILLIDQGIKEQAEEIRKEILQQYQKLAEKAEAILSKEKADQLKPTLLEKISESSSYIDQKTERFAQNVTEKIGLERQVVEQKMLKQSLEEKIGAAKRELVKFQNKEFQDPSLRQAIELLVEDKKKKLEQNLIEKQDVEKNIQALYRELDNRNKEKDQIKSDLTAKTLELAGPIKEAVSLDASPRLNSVEKMVSEIYQAVNERTARLEIIAIERGEEKAQIIQKLNLDSDSDGLINKTELSLGTNPFNPDTDNDGFLDKVEVAAGFNPVSATSQAKVVYQEPTKSRALISDNYKINKIEIFTTQENKKVLKIEGHGPPNSFLTIYIYSELLVLLVKTDENGNFSYTLDRPLEDGYHQVYVAINNNQGEVVERSEGFSFLKTPTALAAIVPPNLPINIISPAESLTRRYSIFVVIIIILSLLIALLAIGFFSKKKEKANSL